MDTHFLYQLCLKANKPCSLEKDVMRLRYHLKVCSVSCRSRLSGDPLSQSFKTSWVKSLRLWRTLALISPQADLRHSLGYPISPANGLRLKHNDKCKQNCRFLSGLFALKEQKVTIYYEHSASNRWPTFQL